MRNESVLCGRHNQYVDALRPRIRQSFTLYTACTMMICMSLISELHHTLNVQHNSDSNLLDKVCIHYGSNSCDALKSALATHLLWC